MIWVGKNLAEQDVISCMYYAPDIGKVCSAKAFAYAAADNSLYDPGRGETPPSSRCITEFGNDHCSENFIKSRKGHARGMQDSESMNGL